MRTASNTAAWSGQRWKRAEFLPPLDRTSQQQERDADATMTPDNQQEYAGPEAVMPTRTAPRAVAPPPR